MKNFAPILLACCLLAAQSAFSQNEKYQLDTLWQSQLPEGMAAADARLFPLVFDSKPGMFSVVSGFRWVQFDDSGKISSETQLPAQLSETVSRQPVFFKIEKYCLDHSGLFALAMDTAARQFLLKITRQPDLRGFAVATALPLPQILNLKNLAQVAASPDNSGWVIAATDSTGQAFAAKIATDGSLGWRENLGLRGEQTPRALQILENGQALLATDARLKNIGDALVEVRQLAADGKPVWRRTLGNAQTPTHADALRTAPDGRVWTFGREAGGFRIAALDGEQEIFFKKNIANPRAAAMAAVFQNWKSDSLPTLLFLENDGRLTCARLVAAVVPAPRPPVGEMITCRFELQFSDSTSEYSVAELVADSSGGGWARTRLGWRLGDDFQLQAKSPEPLFFYVLNRDPKSGRATPAVLFASSLARSADVLPGRDSSFHLDAAGREEFVVLASAERLAAADLAGWWSGAGASDDFSVAGGEGVIRFFRGRVGRFRFFLEVRE